MVSNMDLSNSTTGNVAEIPKPLADAVSVEPVHIRSRAVIYTPCSLQGLVLSRQPPLAGVPEGMCIVPD